MIDHQTLSFDAYLKLIEDLFLNGQRLDPSNDGRPDRRPVVRENVGSLGNLLDEFDFSQSPLPPLVLPNGPRPGRRRSPAPERASRRGNVGLLRAVAIRPMRRGSVISSIATDERGPVTIWVVRIRDDRVQHPYDPGRDRPFPRGRQSVPGAVLMPWTLTVDLLDLNMDDHPRRTSRIGKVAPGPM